MAEDGESLLRQTLMTADEVYVYKIPPLKSSGGHRADDWNLAEPLKTCRLLVERRGDKLVMEFLHGDENAVFAQSTLDVTQGRVAAQVLEPVVDSSRYFALKIQGAGGREALVGFGFRDRDKATDLRESLQHYEKSIQREKEAATMTATTFSIPKLGEGEKLHIGKDGTSRVVKGDKPAGKAAVPLLKKPPPPSDSSAVPVVPEDEEVVELSINMDGIDLNAHKQNHGVDYDDESGVAVFEGDESDWTHDFDVK